MANKKILFLFYFSLFHINLIAMENIQTLVTQSALEHKNLYLASRIVELVAIPKNNFDIGYVSLSPLAHRKDQDDEHIEYIHRPSPLEPSSQRIFSDETFRLFTNMATYQVHNDMPILTEKELLKTFDNVVDDSDILSGIQQECSKKNRFYFNAAIDRITDSSPKERSNNIRMQIIACFYLAFASYYHATIWDAYHAAYRIQSKHKANTVRLAEALEQHKVLSANDIYQILNTYSYYKSGSYEFSPYHKRSDYPDMKCFSWAQVQKGKIIDVKFFDRNGLQQPQFTVDRKKRKLTLKQFREKEIILTKYRLDGTPIQGLQKIKPYVFGYAYKEDSDDIEYVGYKGYLDQHGNERKTSNGKIDRSHP